MTRISSVFNLLKRVGFAVLLLGTANAQPQAPIEWGEARLLMNAPEGIYPSGEGVFAYGDTIVLTGGRVFGNRSLAVVCVSGDNGQTFSPWHTFLTPDSMSALASVAFTSTGIYCCTAVQGLSRGLYRSTDLGHSWTAPTVAIAYLRIVETSGDTIWCSTWNWGNDSLRWTTDGGLSFSSPIGLYLGNGGIDNMSLSDSMIAVTSRTEFEEIYPFLTTYLLIADRVTGVFGDPLMLNPHLRETYSIDIELVPDGTGMINSCARYTTPFPGGGAIFLTLTRDHGNTWSDSDTLEALQSSGAPMIQHVEHEWMAAWYDTIVAPPFIHTGEWFRYSANNGRSWYPSRQAFGEHMAGEIGPMDLREEQARIYANCFEWNGVLGRYFLQWEGQIHRDTLAPVVSNAVVLPQIVPVDTTITFSVSASDNDSLWLITVVMKHPDTEDSLIVPLIRQPDNGYAATWLVPHDTAEWLYYYRAEDMWENVTTYPDSGRFSFVTMPNSIGEHDLLPSSFSLSAYPNPFNPTATIAFTLPRTSVTTVEVYDVTGQLVQTLTQRRMEAGGHHLMLNGASFASGIYFIHVRAAEWSGTLKIAMVR